MSKPEFKPMRVEEYNELTRENRQYGDGAWWSEYFGQRLWCVLLEFGRIIVDVAPQEYRG